MCAAESEALKDCDCDVSLGSLETGLEGVVNASVGVGWDIVDCLCGCLWYCLGEVLIVFCLGGMDGSGGLGVQLGIDLSAEAQSRVNYTSNLGELD